MFRRYLIIIVNGITYKELGFSQLVYLIHILVFWRYLMIIFCGIVGKEFRLSKLVALVVSLGVCGNLLKYEFEY